jgi:hypothetical protein
MRANAIDDGVDTLQVRIPAAAPRVVRVADHVAERRPFAAKLAFLCHDCSSQNLPKMNKASSLAEFAAFRIISLLGMPLLPGPDFQSRADWCRGKISLFSLSITVFMAIFSQRLNEA